MLRNQVILEIKKGENSYQFTFSPGSPAGEIFDALCEMRGFVLGEIQKSTQSEQAQVKVDEPTVATE